MSWFSIWFAVMPFIFAGCYIVRRYFGIRIDGDAALFMSLFWPATPLFLVIVGIIVLVDEFTDSPVGDWKTKRLKQKTQAIIEEQDATALFRQAAEKELEAYLEE